MMDPDGWMFPAGRECLWGGGPGGIQSWQEDLQVQRRTRRFSSPHANNIAPFSALPPAPLPPHWG